MSTDAGAGDSSIRGEASSVKALAQFISWSALAFMTTATVAGLQPVPTMAEYGLASVFLLRCGGDLLTAPSGAGVGGASVRVGGRCLQLGERGHLAAGRLLRGVVPIRADYLLLSEPADVRG